MTHDTNTTESTADPEAQTEKTISNRPSDSLELSRRQLIGSGLATLVTGLAGCTDSDDSSSDGGPGVSSTPTGTTAASSTSGAIKSVEVDGTDLELEFEEDAAPLAIHLVDEAGKNVENWEMEAGTLFEINLVPVEDHEWRYTPGKEYTVVADDYERDLGEATFSASPDLSITDVSYNTEKYHIEAEVHNSGTGPTIVTDAGFDSQSQLVNTAPIDSRGVLYSDMIGERGVSVPAGGTAVAVIKGVSPVIAYGEADSCDEKGVLRATVEDMTGSRVAAESEFSLKQRTEDSSCDDIVFADIESTEPPTKTTSSEE